MLHCTKKSIVDRITIIQNLAMKKNRIFIINGEKI